MIEYENLSNINLESAAKEDWDVLVVGAGPAGSSAAFFLSKLGYKTLLIEAKKLPRAKPCGDGVGPRSVINLYKMGLKDWLENSGFYKTELLRLVSPFGAELISNPKLADFEVIHGYVISRSLLDYKLIELSVNNGASYLEGYPVTEVIKDEDDRAVGVKVGDSKAAKIKSKLVVVADGSNGKVSRMFGQSLNTVEAIGYRGYASNLDDQKHTASIIFTPQFPTGYVWIFPNAATKANIGLGTLGLKNGSDPLNLKKSFDLVFDDLLNPGAEIESKKLGGAMRMNFAKRPVWFKGVAFVGDACGLVSPINGEGISHAIESAQLLAKALEKKPKDNQSLDKGLMNYQKLLNDEFISYFRLGRLLVKLLAQPKRMHSLILKAQKDEELEYLCIGVMANTVHPKKLLNLKTIAKILV